MHKQRDKKDNDSNNPNIIVILIEVEEVVFPTTEGAIKE